MSASQLSITFFLQMFVILAVCRVVAMLASRIGQPHVVGEMIAGVFLGPSLLGLFFPQVQLALFPPESLKVLYVGAQLGVGLYMFLVGVEFDISTFMQRARSAALVSISGMVAPIILGALLALILIKIPGLFSAKATTFEAMLFLGAAMAITAFPMLARIIFERGLTGTPLGTLALAAGAIGDAGAWGVMALVLASFGAGPIIAVKAIAGGIFYTVFTLTVGRKLLARVGVAVEKRGEVTLPILAVTLSALARGLVYRCHWRACRVRRVHSWHRDPPGHLLQRTAPDAGAFAVVFCCDVLHLFRTNTRGWTLVISVQMLLIAGAVILAASVGKIQPAGGCTPAGEDNRTSLPWCADELTRLMELSSSTLGFSEVSSSRPVLDMVLMAVVTTLMATPMFEWVYGRHARQLGQLGPPHAKM